MIILILFLALITRMILANQSFWLDEGASLVIAHQNVNQLLSSLRADFHPPLFYLFLHYWESLGIKQEIFLRLPNIIVGTLTVFVLYKLVKSLTNNNVLSLVSATFLALNPLHIYYSQELRMYVWSCFWTVLSWWFLNKKQYKRFTLISLLNVYTFYGAFLNLVAQGIYLWFADKQVLRSFSKCLLVIGLFFLPWIPTLIQQLNGGTFLQTVLPGWRLLSGTLTLKSLGLIGVKFFLGRINLAEGKLYLLVAISVCLYFGSLILLGLKQRLNNLLIIWILTPIFIAAILSLKTPMLGYWRFISLIPAVSVLLALGIDQLPTKLAWTNFIVVVLTLTLANIMFWVTPGFQREDWRSAVNWASQEPRATSIFAFSDAFAPVRWYNSKLNYSAVLPDLSVNPEILDSTLSDVTAEKTDIYYFEYLSGLTDPGKNIPAWFTNAGYHVDQIKNFSGVGLVYVYKAK